MTGIQKILFASLILIISSCDRIYFDKPQPVDEGNLTLIPKYLQGTWTDEGATISINDSSYQLIEYRNDTLFKKETYTLSDSVILRRAGNILVANVKREGWWELYLIKKNKSNEIIGYYPSQELINKNKRFILKKKDEESYSFIYHYEASLRSNEIKKLNKKHIKNFLILKPDSTMSDDAMNN